MRFLNLGIQTKLMLAIIASVIFVSGLVISVSEKKIKDTWKRAVESHVSEEVIGFSATEENSVSPEPAKQTV